MRYKIVDLRHILEQTGIEIVAVSETKLSEEFPDSQFLLMDICFQLIEGIETAMVAV